jgi:hypothetical protein
MNIRNKALALFVALSTLLAAGIMPARALGATMPEKYAGETLEGISSTKAQKSVGKGWNGFTNAMIPTSQKWLKDLAGIRPFSELHL